MSPAILFLNIGTRNAKNIVAFRDALDVKAMVFENTDQFPQQN